MGKQIDQKVYITGFGGFMGKHLCSLLTEKGVAFSTEKINLLDRKSLLSFFEANDFDIVVHLVGAFGSNFDDLLDANVNTTWNLCNALINTRVKKIIYTSSGAVYGPPSNGIESFETDIPSPDSVYGITKLFAEQVVTQFANYNERQSIILRLPNIYGPGGKGLINQMKNSIIHSHTVTINGDGLKSRDFIHIDDVVNSLYDLITHDFNQSEIFNLSSPVRLNINEVVSILAKKYSFKIIRKPQDHTSKILHMNTQKISKVLKHGHKIMSGQLKDI